MNETQLVVGIVVAIVSFLFWIRERQKARARRERREQLETKGYVPLGPEPGVFPLAVDIAARIWKTSGGTLIVVVLLAVTAVLAFTEQRAHWTFIVVIALCAGFFLLWRIKAEVEDITQTSGNDSDSP